MTFAANIDRVLNGVRTPWMTGATPAANYGRARSLADVSRLFFGLPSVLYVTSRLPMMRISRRFYGKAYFNNNSRDKTTFDYNLDGNLGGAVVVSGGTMT